MPTCFNQLQLRPPVFMWSLLPFFWTILQKHLLRLLVIPENDSGYTTVFSGNGQNECYHLFALCKEGWSAVSVPPA